MPWVLGVAIAFFAVSEGKLGDFRGLLCYNTDWDSFATGGITITVFFIATAITVVFYLLTAAFATKTLKSVGKDESASRARRTILKRGASLVTTFFITWVLFIAVVILSYSGVATSLTLEMVAALMLSLQPTVDAIILLSTIEIRSHMLKRLFLTLTHPSFREEAIGQEQRPRNMSMSVRRQASSMSSRGDHSYRQRESYRNSLMSSRGSVARNSVTQVLLNRLQQVRSKRESVVRSQCSEASASSDFELTTASDKPAALAEPQVLVLQADAVSEFAELDEDHDKAASPEGTMDPNGETQHCAIDRASPSDDTLSLGGIEHAGFEGEDNAEGAVGELALVVRTSPHKFQ